MLTKTWIVCLKCRLHRNHLNESVHESLNPSKLIEKRVKRMDY